MAQPREDSELLPLVPGGKARHAGSERAQKQRCFAVCFGRSRFSPTCQRFTLLAFSIVIVFSGYFSYDLPSITSDELKVPPLSLSNTELGLLFTVYALPNAILPLFSGAFYDRLGVWRGVLVIGAVIGLGIVVIAVGVGANSFPVMLLGRIIYGLGGESLYVGIDVLTTTWFMGSELGLAYGLVQAAGQAGTFAVFLAIPAVVQASDCRLVEAYIVGTLLAAFALAMLFVARQLDKVRTHSPQEEALAHKNPEAADPEAAAAAGGGDGGSSEEGSALLGGGHLPSSSRHCGACGRLLRTRACTFLGFHHLLGLPLEFWCHLVAIAVYSASYFTFLAFGNDFLQAKYDLDDTHSGYLVGAISLSSVVLSPLSGLFLDKFGGNEYAAFGTMFLSVFVFILLGFTNVAVVPVIIVGGLCYGILPSALYPLLAEAVPEDSFPQVYAILTAAINLVLSLSMLVAGRLSDTTAASQGSSAVTLPRHWAHTVAAAAVSGSGNTGVSCGSATGIDPGPDPQPIKPKPDYTYVFVLFTAYVCIGTLVTGWVAFKKLKDTIVERRRAAVAERLEELARPAEGQLQPLQQQQALARTRSVLGIEMQSMGSVDEEGFAKAEAVAVALRLHA